MNWNPGLILLDVLMPASAAVDGEREHGEAGGAGIISKPFNPLHLADRIESLWRNFG